MSDDRKDSAQAETVISVKDLRVQYGEQEILHGISFDVARSETLVILAPVRAKARFCAPWRVWKNPAGDRSG